MTSFPGSVRLLHLTPELPTWRGGTGGATRQFHLLRRLAELGHEVTVVAPVPHGHGGAREALAGAGIRLVESTRPPSRLAEAARALLRNPGLVAAALTRPVLAWQVGVLQDEWYWACVDAAGADESGFSEWNLYGHWVLSHHETHAVHRQLFWRDVTRHPGPSLARPWASTSTSWPRTDTCGARGGHAHGALSREWPRRSRPSFVPEVSLYRAHARRRLRR